MNCHEYALEVLRFADSLCRKDGLTPAHDWNDALYCEAYRYFNDARNSAPATARTVVPARDARGADHS
jgi:hypothetical protein